MSAKPTKKPAWTVGNPSLATLSIEPPAGKKLAGFGSSERPAHQYVNWLFYNVGEWINWLEEQADLLSTSKTQYDAIVGNGGTHYDLAALMADANIANIKSVLVISPQALGAPVVLNRDDMRFDFTPKAFLQKGAGLTIGVQITAKRVRFMNARFIGFSAAGDKALQLTNTSQYCMVTGCFFNTCDTSIEDLGASNGLGMNIEEV